jgi:hypothetical protein
MTKQELHDKYFEVFGKKVPPIYSNNLEWIANVLKEPETSPMVQVKVGAKQEKEFCTDCKIDLSGVGFKDAPTIENLRREQIKAKCKKLGKRIVSDGKVWEILNFNEPLGSFKNGKRQQYKTARNAEDAIDSL